MKLVEVAKSIQPHSLKAVFIVGAPGSGKSTIRRNLRLPDNIVVLDRDDVKTLYQSQRASKIHLEQTFADAANSVAPIFIDTVGLNEQLLTRRINSLKRIGYDVKVIIIRVSETTSLQRAKDREQVEQRHVDPAFISNIHSNMGFVYGSLQRDFPEDVVVFDNDKDSDMDTILPQIQKVVTDFYAAPIQNDLGRQVVNIMREKDINTISPEIVGTSSFYKMLGYSWYSRLS